MIPGRRGVGQAEELHPARLLDLFKTSRIGRSIVLLERVNSTNSAAMEAAAGGIREGTLFLAEEQSEGRGRKGRSWFSVTGRSLVFSIVLRPNRAAEGLTSLIALSAASALDDICDGDDRISGGAEDEVGPAGGASGGAECTGGSSGEVFGGIMIKWPNDLYLNGRKVGGILAEAKDGSVVMGMGLDVNEGEEDFPAEISREAISLRMVTGEWMDRGAVLAAIINAFETMYTIWEDRGLMYFREDLEDRILYINDYVSLESGGVGFVGRLLGVTDEGYLRLEIGGEEKVFSSGDLTPAEEI